MPVPLCQVDAFTDEIFAGNPAAVCLLGEAAPEAWMQRVAAEMNLSETAFLAPHDDGYELRWFTPTVEVDLCGHATLASAHVLWETGRLQPDATARFHTRRSGLLTATRDAEQITLDFPASLAEDTDVPSGLAEALGIAPQRIVRGAFDYLVEVGREDDVRRLDPDFRALGDVEVERGIVVTAQGTNVDFVSRFFAPAAGVDEDPVTGSVHGLLAPYWAARLGRNDLVGYQASARGGTVRVGVRGDRVLLGGQAVTVFRGELLAEPA